MYRDTQERWKNTLTSLQTAMQMQAQASQNLAMTRPCWLTSWVRANRPWALQAMQP